MRAYKRPNCKTCGNIIYNKMKFSKYCKECKDIMLYVQNRVAQLNLKCRQLYPEFDTKITIKVSRKDRRQE